MSIRIRYNKELLDKCIKRDNSTLEREYQKLTKKTRIKFICSCKKEGEKRLDSIHNFGAFCKDCTNKLRYDKVKSTNLKKYGVECSLQSKEVRDKVKATTLKNYGVECNLQSKEVRDKIKATTLKKYGVKHVSQSKEIKDKIKATILQKYGVEHVTQIKEVRDKVKATIIDKYGVDNVLQLKEFRDKLKSTNLKKYGVEHVLQSLEVKDKSKATNLKKYGVEYALQSKEVRDKSKETILQKYGVEYAFQSEEIKDKIKATNIEKYGVEHPSQNSNISDRSLQNGYKNKELITPSGKILKFQGYEPQAYKLLLETYKEEEIINSRKNVPEIWWVDSKGKNHRYFVDFYIPKDNLIVEVKSLRTYSLGKEKIEKTLQASKEAGYKMEVWVINEKGIILEKKMLI